MKKLALLIGINYQNSIAPLKGCINDVKGITKLLVEKFQFSISDIQILLEEAATRQNILNSLDYLISELKSGDIGVLAFHGHGTQVADEPPIDEEDILDEVIVPYDGINDKKVLYENVIRDDEIQERLVKLQQNVSFTFIFDSCHSGTITRDITGATRSVPPSVSVSEIKQLISGLTTSRSLPKEHPLSVGNYYLLTACKAEQQAKDDMTNGYFTAELLKYMEPGITYEQLKEKVIPAVKERSFNQQEPQFDVPNLSLPIFGSQSNLSRGMDQVLKIFGVDILPTDINLESDGTVEIKNSNLFNLVKQLKEKKIKDLFNA
ncbi:caspase family protein [Bacillus sp. SH7-1]|uniref:caspase family protein n=1 Tax=Bacillus sp. SH7-1 TaxID=2217818 RepID=UPI0015D3DBB7|nr:caspase family protein [Bacillus sp. SH7-1]